MPAYTSKLRLTQPAVGENTNTWGPVVNNGVTALVDDAVAGLATITIAASTDYTLSSNNGASDEARCMFLRFAGTPGTSQNVICPASTKLYVVTNASGSAQTLKTASGTGISVPNGETRVLMCDGTNVINVASPAASLAAATFNNGGAGAASGTTYDGSVARTISYNTIGAPSTTGTNASGTWSISVTGSAGSVTAAATFNNSGTGATSGTTFDGSTARTISYNTIGAPSTTGTNASGTWGISITGSAASVSGSTSNGFGTRTVSTLGPSGGSDGDIWYRY
jgi:hypothetical protein